MKQAVATEVVKSGRPSEGHPHTELASGRSLASGRKHDHSPLSEAQYAVLGAQEPADDVAYIFGAICPEQDKGAGLVLPFCNTKAMTLHLAKIALAIPLGAHAIVLIE